MATEEYYFPLKTGIDKYTPQVTKDNIFVVGMHNCHPKAGRIVTSEALNYKQKLGSGSVLGLVSCTGGDFRKNNTFAICADGIHKYNTKAGYFNGGKFYAFDTTLTEPVSVLSTKWGIYAISPELDLTNITSDYVRTVNSAWDYDTGNLKARYILEAKSHLLMANVIEKGVSLPYRVRWSDVSSPGLWASSESGGADYIDIEFDAGPITGMSYQKGYVITYQPNAIWLAEYSTSAYFKFEPAYTYLGNRFHNSVIHCSEKDFFISYDNFYIMDGLDITPIGDKIWREFLESSSNLQDGDTVRGFWNPYDSEVFWNYTDYDNNPISLVYNYRLGEWSKRDSGSITCFNRESRDTPRLSGDTNGIIYVKDYAYGAGIPRKLAGDGYFETSEIFLDYASGVKEVTEVKLQYTQIGTPDLTLQIGTRDSQTGQIKWGTPITGDQIAGDKSFYTRDQPIGHYVRFKFSWTNTEFDYIDEIIGLCVKLRQPGMDVER